MSEKLPLYIFDLDGTLVDTRADLTTAVNLTRADYGLPPLPLPTVVGFVGNGMHRLVQAALADATAPWDIEDAVAAMRRHYGQHLLDETRAYPGVPEAMAELAGTPCHRAVVTNKPEAPARRILDGLGLASFFAYVIGGDSLPALKPDPLPLLHLLAETDAALERSWIVGDNRTDLEAGRRAGMRRCYCRYGFGRKGDEEAEMEVDDLRAFVAGQVGRAQRGVAPVVPPRRPNPVAEPRAGE
ncbi:MAG: HAD hydrolase-like protein [Lentisphaeria bacterium]|nr:HAD hydrolase-like protein [Lentisphaeria bacterium]